MIDTPGLITKSPRLPPADRGDSPSPRACMVAADGRILTEPINPPPSAAAHFILPVFRFLDILTAKIPVYRLRKGLRSCRRNPNFALLVLAAAVELAVSARASDPSGIPRLRTLIPRKVASTQIRSLECVQKSPDFVLWDAEKKITPGAAGYVYYLEQSIGNRLLLTDQNGERVAGLMPAPSSQSTRPRRSFRARSRRTPRSAFAFLMRGVVRLECEDLDHAMTDFDQSLKLDPSSAPALIARAYLWLWKSRLDQAVADATRAIELNPRNAYAFVSAASFIVT